MADNIYIYNKKTGERYLLGEIQNDFNMSFVIDGTKDSAELKVIGYYYEELEPYTICWHEKTDSWWIISSDKIERYQNENGTFVYKHNLSLVGAIELLNARDLTDCGFNNNKYTIREFILRLFKLSTFEYNISIYSPVLQIYNKKVNFIKTFENYSLLSALREFLDSYNMSPKLTFSNYLDADTHKYRLSGATLRIVSKTGMTDYQVRDINDFDEVQETKTMSKESFGACVVSNAENVNSSITKTFPSTGAAKLSAEEYLIKHNNAVLRLPSNVYKANWLKLKFEYDISVVFSYGGNNPTYFNTKVDITSDMSIESAKNYFIEKVNAQSSYTQAQRAETIADFESKWEQIKVQMKKAGTITFYEGNDINPVSGGIVKGVGVPYIPKITFGESATLKEVILTDEDTRNCLPTKEQGIYWNRGSNLIKGFNFIYTGGIYGESFVIAFDNTDLQDDSRAFFVYNLGAGYGSIAFGPLEWTERRVYLKECYFIFNYIPMSDLKIKVDNDCDKLDMQLYNQSGKLVDSVALSKLLNSYSKEISSDTITKYMSYYKYSDVPKVGTIVNNNGIEYVINNVSLDFIQNENETYFIDGEFTMSKRVSTKSLMVNPNTNIRDYGIPQKYNVQRKQLYRDYYEITYYHKYDDANLEEPYLALNRVLNLSNYGSAQNDFVCVMKLTYDELVENSHSWYYQLETTNYYLDKMYYVVLNFLDNNIIGYGSQNVFSGFDITRIISGTTDLLNTPISYVDSKGEVKDIEMRFLNNLELTTIYLLYNVMLITTIGTMYGGTLYNYSVFIPEEIYEGGISTAIYDEYDSPTYDGYGSYPTHLDITYFITNTCGYTGEANGLEVSYIAMSSENGEAVINDYFITKEGNNYYLNISTQSQSLGLWSVNFSVKVYTTRWNGANAVSTFKINEYNYNKDAIEVPFFEYCTQIDDSDHVLIGDNILKEYGEDYVYFYTFKVGDNLTPESAYDNQSVQLTMYDTVSFNTSNLPTTISVNFHNSTTYQNGTFTNNGTATIPNGKDVAIFRHAYNIKNQTQSGGELVMILKKKPSGLSTLYLNHYKLK